MSARILNALGILSSDVPTGNLIWDDAINGVDALAVRGRMTIPFKTLTAAKNAAVSGDTIMVLPGTYEDKNLLKNGVNWHFLPGAKVTYSGGIAGGIFDDSANGSNGAVTASVTGHGEFNVSASTGTAYVVHASASGSNMFVQARKIASNNASVKIAQSSGSCTVEVMEDIVCDSDNAVAVTGAGTNNSVKARDIISSAGNALYIGAGGIDITARNLRSSALQAVGLDGGTGPVTVRAFELYSASNYGVYYYGTSSPLLTIIGARIKTDWANSAGRAVMIGSNSPNAVRLANCVLIASGSGDNSIYAANAGTKVHFLPGASANKSKNGNVVEVGGVITVSTDIS